MNWMLTKVTTDGTARRAQLDFTHVAGKTGTSTGPKDVWFMGFTGKYVASVWFGNDDNRAMRSGSTGGGVAAPVWHELMSAIHGTDPIPTLPGLKPHPVQVARLEQLAEEKKLAPGGSQSQRKQKSIMPTATRTALRRLAETMRKLFKDSGATPLGNDPGQVHPLTRKLNRRAEAPRSSTDTRKPLRRQR
jgi:penicillin-binding protein 1A